MVTQIEQMGQKLLASTVVVYDPSDGQITYVHHTLTADGGQHPDEKGLETAALALASQSGAKKKLAILHVPYERLKQNVRYRVDIQNPSLLEIG